MNAVEEYLEVQASQRISYHCKFCGKDGVAILGCTPEEAMSLGMTLQNWIAMLACNRCADFYVQQVKIARSILAICHYLQSARMGHNKKLREDAEGLARTELITRTQRYIACVSFHFRRTNNWHESYVDGFIEKPENAGAYLKFAFNAFKSGKWK